MSSQPAEPLSASGPSVPEQPRPEVQSTVRAKATPALSSEARAVIVSSTASRFILVSLPFVVRLSFRNVLADPNCTPFPSHVPYRNPPSYPDPPHAPSYLQCIF